MIAHLLECWAVFIASGYALIAWAYIAERRANIEWVDTQLRRAGMVRRPGESDDEAMQRLFAELEFRRQGCYDETVVDR